MAVLSDYTSGTITVTQNSVNFTGTNTLWRTAQFREGDTVQLKGYTAALSPNFGRGRLERLHIACGSCRMARV